MIKREIIILFVILIILFKDWFLNIKSLPIKQSFIDNE
jgi:hypothetical protein